MTYAIPPKKLPPKQRYVLVTDPAEIAAIERAGLNDPVGGLIEGRWYAEAHSLAMYRGKDVEIDPSTA